jgi:hypothetical protein
MVAKGPKKMSDQVAFTVNFESNVHQLNEMRFPDLQVSDTEQEIILDPNVQIVNLEADEQPEVFDLTPDEDSDEEDEVFIDRYLMTRSP